MLVYNPVYAMIGKKEVFMPIKKCKSCEKEYDTENHMQGWCSKSCKIKSKIEIDKKTGCWDWKGASNNRYGKMRWEKKWISSHRVSYTEFVGEIPDGKVVCHKCDNKKCCNPEHLWVGTQKENVRDAIEKGRHHVRDKNPFVKFTEDQLKEMRLLGKEGLSIQRVCRIFNCTAPYVVQVTKGEHFGF